MAVTNEELGGTGISSFVAASMIIQTQKTDSSRPKLRKIGVQQQGIYNFSSDRP